MNEFDKLVAQKTQANPTKEVEGAFACQNCGEIVETGRYNGERLVLSWTCSQGHLSLVMDIWL